MLRILAPDTAMHALVCYKVLIGVNFIVSGVSFISNPQKENVC
jgi:hypothetical protein